MVSLEETENTRKNLDVLETSAAVNAIKSQDPLSEVYEFFSQP